MSADTVPTGWYDDPYGAGAERYHDGRQWTSETRSPVAHGLGLPESPMTPRARWKRVTAAGATAILVATGYLLAGRHWPWFAIVEATVVTVILVAGPRTSYSRWNAAFAVALPPWGLWIIANMAYRAAFWPFRDWTGPADDRPS